MSYYNHDAIYEMNEKWAFRRVCLHTTSYHKNNYQKTVVNLVLMDRDITIYVWTDRICNISSNFQ